jgi:hypothetical protein
MSYFYTPYFVKLGTGVINHETDDLRVLLVGTSHVEDDEQEFVGGLGTLDEISGTGYTPGPGGSGRQTLDSRVVAADLVNKRAEMQMDNPVFAGLDAGDVQAAIVYKHNDGSDDNLNELIAYIDEGGFPFTSNGTNVTVIVDVEGFFSWGN